MSEAKTKAAAVADALLHFDADELSYLSANVFYGRGSLSKADRRMACQIIRTVEAIVRDIRPNQELAQ